MTTNEPSSISSIIDFTALPVAEIADILQQLGLQLAIMLLKDEKQPALSSLLTLPLVELLLPGADVTAPLLTVSATQPRQRQSAERRGARIIISWLTRFPKLSELIRSTKRLPFSRRFLPSQQPSIQYDDLVEKAVRNQIDSLTWRREINRRLHHALYGNPSQSVPPLLWSLIGELAWNDLTVQQKLGGQVRNYLRPHYLFFPDFGPTPQFSPRTFWALLALARPATSSLLITTEQRNCYVATYHLQQIARKQVLVEGWANFWDQWLLWQVYCRRSDAFDPETEMGISLLNLPLFTLFSDKQPPSDPNQSEIRRYRLAISDWHNNAPAWLLRQYQEWQFEQGVIKHV